MTRHANFILRSYPRPLIGVRHKLEYDMDKGMILNIPRRFVKSEWGGTETVITETSKSLISMGYKAKIVTTQALSSKSNDTIYDIPVKRFPYSYTRLGLKNQNKLLLDKRGGNMYSIRMIQQQCIFL